MAQDVHNKDINPMLIRYTQNKQAGAVKMSLLRVPDFKSLPTLMHSCVTNNPNSNFSKPIFFICIMDLIIVSTS